MEIRRVAQVSANWVDLIHIQKAAIYKQTENNNIKNLKKKYTAVNLSCLKALFKLSVVSLVRL